MNSSTSNNVRTIHQPQQFGDAERFLTALANRATQRDEIRRQLAEKAAMRDLAKSLQRG